MPPVVVQLQALDGTWENCGVDRASGLVPENPRFDADGWGSKGSTFDLRRDPSATWPDVSAFTPVKALIDGSLVWSGRVSETPSRDGADQVMSVACEGWQAHLDDDLVERVYVHNRLSSWQDTRSFLSAPLTNFKAAANVSNSGGITLGWPKGYVIAVGDSVGVTLDLGASTATKASMTFTDTTFSAGSFTVYLKAHSDLATIISGGTTLASIDPATNSTLSGTCSASRYLSIIVYCTAGGALGADRMLRVTDAICAGDTTYMSTSSSSLLASTVVKDALTKGTALLSTDQSGVTATSFVIPEYAPTEPRTPRDHINAVNAFHGWQAKIDVDRRAVFQALPTRPKYEIGDWSSVEIQDSSQNSGQDIYNKVIVTGQDPAGVPVRAIRGSANVGVTRDQTDIAFTNPSFDTNITGWDTSLGFARTTTAGEFDSAPAGAKLPGAGGSYSTYTDLTGTAKAGRPYLFTFRFKSSAVDANAYVYIVAGQGGAGQQDFPKQYIATGVWQTVSFVWTPSAATASPRLSLTFVHAGSLTGYFDSFQIAIGGSLPDRRGFVRTKQLAVGPTIASDGVAAATIGDAWLSSHFSTPFRGSITLTGPNAIRNRLSGQPVPLAELLNNTGELIYFADRPDPDTGTAGRNGRIAAVSYDPVADVATVTLDNTRDDLDFLLSRMAVVQGS